MSRIRRIAFAFILASWCPTASSITGEALAEICGVTQGPGRNEDACWSYIVGLVDGVAWGRMRTEEMPKPEDSPLAKEIKLELVKARSRVYCPPNGVTSEQELAVVKKRLRDNPTEWHMPAAFHVVNALRTAFSCLK